LPWAPLMMRVTWRQHATSDNLFSFLLYFLPSLALRYHSGQYQISSQNKNQLKHNAICSSLFTFFYLCGFFWWCSASVSLILANTFPHLHLATSKPSSHSRLIRHPSLPSNSLLLQGMDFWALSATSVFPSSAFLLSLLPKDNQKHHNEAQEPGDV